VREFTLLGIILVGLLALIGGCSHSSYEHPADDDAADDDVADDDVADDDSGDDDSAGYGEPIAVEPQEAVATNITLEVYSNGWGHLVDTQYLDEEGPIVFDVVEEDPYNSHPSHYIYARADGFYTELYYADLNDTIDVDLDAVPEVAHAVTGVLFSMQTYFADHCAADQLMEMTGPDGFATEVTTDSQGRWGLGHIDEGIYQFSFTYDGQGFGFVIDNTKGTDYQEYGFYEPAQAGPPPR